MAITTAMPTSFKVELLNGVHDFSTDTFKIALYTSSATLGATTTVYSATNEISGSGYSAGGAAVTAVAPTSSGTTALVDFDDVTWVSASITANGALIYNSSQGDKAVAVLAFGGDKTTSAGGTFTVVFPAATATEAIVRVT